MNIKMTEDAQTIIFENGEEKIMVAQTMFGTIVTGKESDNTTFETIDEVNEEFLINEFGEETAQKILQNTQMIAEVIKEVIKSMEEPEPGVYLR